MIAIVNKPDFGTDEREEDTQEDDADREEEEGESEERSDGEMFVEFAREGEAKSELTAEAMAEER